MAQAGFPAILTHTLIELLDDWRVDTNSILAHAGLVREALAAGGARIEREAHLRVIRQALALCGRRDLGLQFGKRISLRHYGVLGHAMLSSASIRHVFELFLRYQRMTGPLLGVSLHTEGKLAVVRRHDLIELGALREFAVEEFLSSWVAVIGSLLEAPFEPSEVRVSYPAPPHAELYSSVLQCPVIFDAGVVELRFDVSYLERPLSLADPATAELCRERSEQLLAQLDDQGGLVEDVRRALMASPSIFPGIEHVAQRLHVSVRTLRRKLAAERTSFRAIDREIRHALALQYLQGTDLPIKQIAYLVGYDDPANFSRAFQRWARCSPRRSRCISGN